MICLVVLQGGPGGGQDGDDSDQEDDDEDYPPPMPPADWGAHPAPGWLPAHVAGGAGGMQLALPQRFALGEAEQRPSFNRQEVGYFMLSLRMEGMHEARHCPAAVCRVNFVHS